MEEWELIENDEEVFSMDNDSEISFREDGIYRKKKIVTYKKRVTYHEYGKIYEEYTVNNSWEKCGEYKEWDEDGKLVAIRIYENDVEKSSCTDFYENGNKKYENVYYDNEKTLTKLIHYYMNGQIRSSTEIKSVDECNPEREGLRMEYYEDGQKRSETNYVNGYKTGVCRVWYPNGILEVEEEYGPYERLNGIRRVWTQKGELIKEEFYEKGVLQKRIVKLYATCP